MKVVRRIAAVLIGLLLFTAGFMKLIDPVGAGLIVAEYFKFFHIGFVIPLSKAFAVALSCFEALLGITMVCGLWRRAVAIMSAALLLFFTALTFILWIFNPEMDCGCFGEMVHLTHLQSLLKNVALCLLWALAFVPFSKLEQPQKIKYFSCGLASAYLVFVCVYNLLGVPTLDYSPFHEGTELFGVHIYDTEAPVLSFYDRDWNYCDSLAIRGDVVTVSVYEPERMSERRWKRISEFTKEAERAGVRPLLLVASVPDEAPDGVEVYFADPKTLVSLNRSNGGATLVRDGQIVGKTSVHFLPDRDELDEILYKSSTESVIEFNSGKNIWIQASFLAIVALMLLL